MDEKPNGNGAELPAGSQQRDLVARIGSFYFCPRSAEAADPQLVGELVDALNSDPRVSAVTSPEVEPDWGRRGKVFPSTLSAGSLRPLLVGSDGEVYLRWSDPISFKVRVPKKNQEPFRGKPIPTDEYLVLWDGKFALVGWKMPDPPSVGGSGGHVVVDVLERAASSTGGTLVVQACSPGCDYQFHHTTAVVSTDESRRSWGFDQTPHPLVVEVKAPMSGTAEEVFAILFEELKGAVRDFGDMLNLSHRIDAIERAVRSDLSGLLKLQADRAHLATHTELRFLRERWQFRGWRRRSRELMARIWLGMASIETLRRRWQERRHYYLEELRERPGIELLFARDEAPESDHIETLDLGILQAAVDHLGGALDNRAIALATALGAVAGALAGWLVSLL